MKNIENIDKITKEIGEFKENHVFFKNQTQEHLFAAMVTAYFYYDGDLTRSCFNKIFVDGCLDGGFDIILNDESTDGNDAVLIQSKMSENLDKMAILSILDKMNIGLNNFKNGDLKNFNKKVKTALYNVKDSMNDSGGYKFVIFTTYQPSDKIKEDIFAEIRKNKNYDNITIEIRFASDICEQIDFVKNTKDFVEFDRICYDNQAGKLTYGEDGVIINVSANELKRLYHMYNTKGLFNKNLRYYIRNQKVDSGINETLNKKSAEFWYLNNGIIIGCEDYYYDGNRVCLERFSIVNGGQTTTLIGQNNKLNKETDFYVVCKIIKNKDAAFINSVAEASNSQKPINPRDLIANRREQTALKKLFAANNPRVNIEIKRGEAKPDWIKTLDKWQKIKNEDIGEILLSFMFQRPGTARGNKKMMFTNEDLYSQIFRREFRTESIIDILKIRDIYEKYVDKNIENFNSEQLQVANNAKQCILALIGLFLKKQRGVISGTVFKGLQDKDKDDRKLVMTDIEFGSILSQDDDMENSLERVFGLFIELLTASYMDELEGKRTTSASNYFKTDSKYYEIIAPFIINRYNMRLDVRKDIDKAMKDAFV